MGAAGLGPATFVGDNVRELIGFVPEEFLRDLERVASGERFDAILCDLMMPDMNGMILHAAIVRRLVG